MTLPSESTPRDPPATAARGELDATVALLYGSLKELARRATRGRSGRQLITPTELVHESYLRLSKSALGRLRQTEFLALAATVIRHVLVDRARELEALKRGARFRRLTLDGRCIASAAPIDLLVLDEALKKLAALDARQALIVELKFFGGLDVPAIAGLLGVSERTVKRQWHVAKAWLHREVTSDE